MATWYNTLSPRGTTVPREAPRRRTKDVVSEVALVPEVRGVHPGTFLMLRDGLRVPMTSAFWYQTMSLRHTPDLKETAPFEATLCVHTAWIIQLYRRSK